VDASADAARLASILARLDRPVVLVGMMGVGKSSLGRKLANQLGAPSSMPTTPSRPLPR
jgi:shikimate kinase